MKRLRVWLFLTSKGFLLSTITDATYVPDALKKIEELNTRFPQTPYRLVECVEARKRRS